MKRNLVTPLATLAFALSTALAQAHPGHDLFDNGVLHTLISPDHLLILAISGATLLGLSFLIRRTLPRFGLQFTGASLVLGALAVWSAS